MVGSALERLTDGLVLLRFSASCLVVPNIYDVWRNVSATFYWPFGTTIHSRQKCIWMQCIESLHPFECNECICKSYGKILRSLCFLVIFPGNFCLLCSCTIVMIIVAAFCWGSGSVDCSTSVHCTNGLLHEGILRLFSHKSISDPFRISYTTTTTALTLMSLRNSRWKQEAFFFALSLFVRAGIFQQQGKNFYIHQAGQRTRCKEAGR